jgi:rare lipoprotein A
LQAPSAIVGERTPAAGVALYARMRATLVFVRFWLQWATLAIFLFAFLGCGEYLPASIPPVSSFARPSPHTTQESAPSEAHMMMASWYGPGLYGCRTSSGDRLDSNRLTAASRTLPLGTYARVTNLDNGHAVVVRINDRGPYVGGRGIDLSDAAAERLGLAHKGVSLVRVMRLNTSASTLPAEPRRSGTRRVRRQYNSHRRRGGRSVRLIPAPVRTWLVALTR